MFFLFSAEPSIYLKNTKPRQKFFAKEDDENIPAQEILNQLCIVSGADSNYFEMLVELFESIKATKYYNKAPLVVIDCGLSEDQKKHLIEKFDAIIYDPDWDVNVKAGTPSHVKCLSVRPFLDKHLPQYRYFLWIDSDAWVQCEYALHRFVNLCAKQGFAMCKGLHPTKLTAYRLPLWDKISRAFKPALNGGVFCIDAQSKYPQLWRDYVHELNRDTFFRSQWDEMTAWVIYHDNKLEYLKNDENYLTIYGLPITHGDNVLRHPQTLQPVGVVHLMMHKYARTGQNPKTMHPLKNTTKELSIFQRLVNLAQSFKWHRLKPALENKSGYVSVSIRYHEPLNSN